MKRRAFNVIVAAVAAAIAACGPAASNASDQGEGQDRPIVRAGRAAISNLTMYRLNAGVNRIPNFTGDGRDGNIVMAWRDNGNAHGFDVFMVMAPTAAGRSDWNLVPIGGESDLIVRDTPHVDEDFVRSVRFGRGTIEGRHETLLFIASRQIEAGYPAPARTRIQVMVLRNRGDDPTGPNDFFQPYADFIAARRYCNSEVALLNEVGVPLRQGFQGFDSVNGCGSD